MARYSRQKALPSLALAADLPRFAIAKLHHLRLANLWKPISLQVHGSSHNDHRLTNVRLG
jgi:hypothetical protein